MEFPRPRGRGEGSESHHREGRSTTPRTFEQAYRLFLTEYFVAWNEPIRATVTVSGAATSVKPREIPYCTPEQMRCELRDILRELVVVYEHSSLPALPQPDQLLHIQLYRQDNTALPLLSIPRRAAP